MRKKSYSEHKDQELINKSISDASTALMIEIMLENKKRWEEREKQKPKDRKPWI
jgi:hypothetical protein